MASGSTGGDNNGNSSHFMVANGSNNVGNGKKNLSMMASGSTGGDNNGNSSHFMVANGSNNVGNGSVKGPWGVSNGSMLSTCQGSGEGPSSKLAESSHGKINAWGTQGSSTNVGINPSTLNPNANHGAWPVLQNTGSNPHGPVGNGNGGTNTQQSTIGQTPSMQSINSKMSWGCLQENMSEAGVNGTNKVPSGQPQNLNTEFNGPNNTTNTMTSSLPNSTGSMQMNEQPPGHRAWPMSTGGSPQLPISPVSNGTSISQHGNSEGINSGSYGTAWGVPPGTNYSGDKCPIPKGQAVGDTVNATLMQSGANGSSVSAASLKNNNNNGMGGRGGGWDSAPATSQNMSWGAGSGVGPAGIPRPWGSVSNGEWNTLPSNSQHSNDSTNGSRKGTNGWKSLEDDALGIGSSGQASQGSTWNKSTGSEGSGESLGGRSERDGQCGGNRRRGNQQGMINAALSKIDVDPRVLSNTGWGQTPVHQNTAWDVSSSDKKTGNGHTGWGSAPPQASNSGGWGDGPSTNKSSDSSVSGWTETKPSTGWGETKGPVGQSGWEDAPSVTMNKGGSSWNGTKDEKSSSWNNPSKAKQGWGGEGPKGNHWGEPQKSGSGGWDSDSDRSGSAWSEPGRCGTSNTWGGSGGTNTPDQSGPTTGWGEPHKTNNQNQTWREPIKSSHPQDSSMGTFRSGSTSQTGAPGQNKPAGWLGGPMPTASKEEESTGWEDPSPESIRRRMEIDDGTSAWGDPNKYICSNVNMWNKNTAGEQDGMAVSQPPQAQSTMAPKEKNCSSGWGEPYGGPQKIESSTWGEHAAPPVTVDNGTSTWGKPVDTGSSWEEPGRQNSGGSGWSNAAIGQQSQHKSGTSHLQLGQRTFFDFSFFDLISSCFRLLLQQKAQSQRAMPVNSRQQQEQGRGLGLSQQMIQPPRHLDPSLMKQQTSPQPPSLHQPSLKSYMENFMTPNASDLQKEQSSLSSFNNFPLGLNSNLNVSNLDIGSVGFKEPQSRLKKWTAMDISVNSPLDQNPSKSGAITSGLRLEDSPFGPYDFINASNASISPPGSVGDGWPSRAKSPHGSTNVNWPPEFRPGEPWKGYPNIDPETDPFVTPGSVINNLSINTVRDVDHLRDRNNGPSSSLTTTLPSNSAWTSIRASNHNSSLSSTAQSTSARNSDSKWSPGTVTNTSLAHELWKVPLPSKGISAPSRPPPGLTGQKQPSSWDNSSLRLPGWGSSESRFNSGSSWGDSSSGRTNWLVLKNLTPQIDGSTLRTLCMQHGPLITFHLNLPHGNAVVCYSSKEEAAKAQKSLHMCVLGNTTILAEFASEEEINRFFAQGQSMTASPSWQTLGSSQNRIGSIEGSHPFPNRTDPNHWNGSGDLHGSSLWGVPNYSTSLWGSPSGGEGGRINSPSPISSFLPESM
uniref:Trinucleotide repeat-containing gene 6A protein-like n=1 Tax=Sinocyclocheilus rhinocerous TaxID=307959 RepID=A0A673J571_9TELE